jgi:arginyl-tRNA synthetase
MTADRLDDLAKKISTRSGTAEMMRLLLRFIIQDDSQMTVARLALAQTVVTGLASGLGLLGVEAPEETR